MGKNCNFIHGDGSSWKLTYDNGILVIQVVWNARTNEKKSFLIKLSRVFTCYNLPSADRWKKQQAL
jgi:hypothetical protein